MRRQTYMGSCRQFEKVGRGQTQRCSPLLAKACVRANTLQRCRQIHGQTRQAWHQCFVVNYGLVEKGAHFVECRYHF
jgi:hypothetical protein